MQRQSLVLTLFNSPNEENFNLLKEYTSFNLLTITFEGKVKALSSRDPWNGYRTEKGNHVTKVRWHHGVCGLALDVHREQLLGDRTSENSNLEIKSRTATFDVSIANRVAPYSYPLSFLAPLWLFSLYSVPGRRQGGVDGVSWPHQPLKNVQKKNFLVLKCSKKIFF